jgi:hypothetical protein
MDEPQFYEIRIEGYLAERWSDWFAGLAISNGPGKQTTLSGLLQDQAELFGVLGKIQALHLILISVNRI